MWSLAERGSSVSGQGALGAAVARHHADGFGQRQACPAANLLDRLDFAAEPYQVKNVAFLGGIQAEWGTAPVEQFNRENRSML